MEEKTNKIIFEEKDGKRREWAIPNDKLFSNMIKDFKDRLHSLWNVSGWVRGLHVDEDTENRIEESN